MVELWQYVLQLAHHFGHIMTNILGCYIIKILKFPDMLPG